MNISTFVSLFATLVTHPKPTGVLEETHAALTGAKPFPSPPPPKPPSPVFNILTAGLDWPWGGFWLLGAWFIDMSSASASRNSENNFTSLRLGWLSKCNSWRTEANLKPVWVSIFASTSLLRFRTLAKTMGSGRTSPNSSHLLNQRIHCLISPAKSLGCPTNWKSVNLFNKTALSAWPRLVKTIQSKHDLGGSHFSGRYQF